MKAIEVVSIPVTDQEASKNFYLKFGFTLVLEAPFDQNRKWIQLALPGQSGVSITLVNWFSDMNPGSVDGFIIKTDDIHGDKADLNAQGISTGEIDETPWGLFLGVADPDGNKLSLHQL